MQREERRVRFARDGDDARQRSAGRARQLRRALQVRQQQVRQQEVPEVVRRHRELEPVH